MLIYVTNDVDHITFMLGVMLVMLVMLL